MPHPTVEAVRCVAADAQRGRGRCQMCGSWTPRSSMSFLLAFSPPIISTPSTPPHASDLAIDMRVYAVIAPATPAPTPSNTSSLSWYAAGPTSPAHLR